jgi:pimeloyl-ACP methyl ester carboxylesterase
MNSVYRKFRGSMLCLAMAIAAAAVLSAQNGSSGYRYVTIPASNSIQEDLIDTFPLGTFTANNQLATLFEIPSTPNTCGYNGLGPCNYYDAFGFDGAGQSITIDVSIPNVAHVFTLMNAYTPVAGQQLATIEFFGSNGATETFPLVAGQDIRDFYQGSFANTLTNGIPGVNAVNAFSCVDPATCLGGGGTGNVTTGAAGTYVIDEQQFSLSPAFLTQNLVKIVITDTYDGSDPILLGITTDQGTPPAVVIPGVMGTSLYLGDELLWVNCPLAAKIPDSSYLTSLYIDADGNSVYPIQTGHVFDGSLLCFGFSSVLNFYGGLIQSLQGAGYELGKTLFVFPYDWRIDNATNANKLNTFIETTVIPQSGQSQVDILAHSMGGLVTRAYAATFGESRLDKIIYMGTPQRGAPKAFATIVNDSMVDTSLGISLPPLIGAQAIGQFSSTLPSVFQLLPRDPFIEAPPTGGELSLNESYLDPPQGDGFLRSTTWVGAANAFHSSISSPLAVSQFEIAGSGIPTLSGLQLLEDPARQPRAWCSIPGNGDSTVPVLSATGAPGSNTQVFYVGGIAHDALPNNPTVQSLVLNILGNNSTAPLPPGVSTVPFPTGGMIAWCSHSPINVAIADVDGNVDGLALDGSIQTEIPLSSFFGLGENQTGLLTLNQTYQVGISGTAVGIFSLQFNQEDSSGNVTQTTSFTNVPIGTASKGSLTLSPTGGAPILELDLDGDGVIDISLPANSTVDAATAAHILSLILPTLSLNAGIERSLLAKIEAATAAINDGETCKAKYIFTALKHEIAAQSGKRVPVSQAKGLLVIVDGMIRQISSGCCRVQG